MKKKKKPHCIDPKKSFGLDPYTPNLPMTTKSFAESISTHLTLHLGKDLYTTTRRDWFKSTAYAIKERLMHRWLQTQRSYYKKDVKRIYYFSMEFLMGRSLGNNILNLGVKDPCCSALNKLGQDMETIQSVESDPALGNGGLGRLASCFLDSMASNNLPAYGYGLRYEFGNFAQKIIQGKQVENADYWLQFGNIWEIERPENTYTVRFGGVVKDFVNSKKQWKHVWLHDQSVLAIAHDTPICGYKNKVVNTLRLWSAKAIEQLNFSYFKEGDYIKALENQIKMENISRVLYPDDTTYEGKSLRFKQQYFFVSASLQDILRRYKKERSSFETFPQKVAIQLNDTHPALSILELMRLLIDIENLTWKKAWDIVTQTFSYTNHTTLPEALEKWPIKLFEEFLPRHLKILYEINSRFLEDIKSGFSSDTDILRRMSLIEEGKEKMVRMTHLAIVGSHTVNGVAHLHTEILKNRVFQDFYRYQPQKFINITNGISLRRWLMLANPELSDLISEAIGTSWTKNFDKLNDLEAFAKDSSFQEKWAAVKMKKKDNLAHYVKDHLSIDLDREALFNSHIKRIHEYKRQLLKIMHVIHLYTHSKNNPSQNTLKRVVIFSGKAASGYLMAKKIIHLIDAVATVINQDPDIKNLKVIFLPNYGVTLAEKIIPATDLSEQISTAGMEASGTGNMKFAVNGALTIATLDGANIEICDHVGKDNIFIFGRTAPEVEIMRKRHLSPREQYNKSKNLRNVIDSIKLDVFSSKTPGIFKDILEELLQRDYFLNMFDFDDYLSQQKKIEDLYQNPRTWTEKSILNVARMSYFSSDRSIREYSEKVWKIPKLSQNA